MFQTTRAGQLIRIGPLATLLVNSKVKLFQNDYGPVPATVKADLTEADFTGYVAHTIAAFGAPYVHSDGEARIAGPSHQFDRTAGATSNQIYGYWIETAAGDVVGVERFADAPVPMAVVGDTLIMIATVTLHGGSGVLA